MLALNIVDQVPKFITLFFFSVILYFMSVSGKLGGSICSPGIQLITAFRQGLAYTADQWFVFLLFVWITT
jgi:hypothetical protein